MQNMIGFGVGALFFVNAGLLFYIEVGLARLSVCLSVSLSAHLALHLLVSPKASSVSC
jgi:hypothetical protein